ncbi:MAG: hypothetical protein EHM37_02290 [Deltaproteobacteria bacterium]|nr:MAG: hypothetical protein EHM37_17375 [Deltaproteobacteria bacterium]RPJ12086.1 MAG: hypothetical protein EHM37_09850 [Deltaproteobacteria bacterium]RPJ16339.1 MAG: hypothetical protein EHM37_02290 [Deltaproteobacteria bacterium]
MCSCLYVPVLCWDAAAVGPTSNSPQPLRRWARSCRIWTMPTKKGF